MVAGATGQVSGTPKDEAPQEMSTSPDDGPTSHVLAVIENIATTVLIDSG